MTKPVGTGVALWPTRYISAEETALGAEGLIASGVVDDIYIFDQLGGWWPPSLWNETNAPIAAKIRDFDSFPDIAALGGYLSARIRDTGIVFSHDTLRRGPAELTQLMLTMADLTEGRATYALGAGEIKQAKPFGHKRSEGLRRLEDSLKVFHAFWDSDGPIDYDGQIWKLQQAFIGGAKAHRPKLWIMGGGPKIIDLATSYADGFVTAVPWVFRTPEDTEQRISAMKQQLESKGRDPDAFQFGGFILGMCHEDEDLIERSFDNPLIKFWTASMGRLNMQDWVDEGYESPFPLDWHYAMKLLPQIMDPAEIDAALAKVTLPMSRSSWFTGSAEKIFADVQPFIDAGLTWVCPCDCLGVTLPEEDWPAAMQRSLDFCRMAKQQAPLTAR